MLGATLHFPAILYWLGSPDTGILAANYASIFLLSAAFLAVGMFASSFTEHQVVALIVGFGLLLILWILSWIDFLSEAPWATAASYISMLSHQADLAKGLVHLKDLVYYVTFVGFFLFATQQRVEAYRWQ
jgi:ABC-2 type transport system permease protein